MYNKYVTMRKMITASIIIFLSIYSLAITKHNNSVLKHVAFFLIFEFLKVTKAPNPW